MIYEKVAIVTGAASGIGYAIAESLSKSGAKVVMADINEDLLKEASERLGADYYLGDLSQKDACKGLVDHSLNKFSKVDILVNVAGIQNVAPIEEFPEDKWDFMMALMLRSPFLLTKYLWPTMKENGWGRVINMSSIHGLVASEFKSAYVSAKHGLVGLTKTAALEGGPFGITVNAICPAYVRTPLVDNQIAAQALTHGISPEKVISEIMLQKAAIKTMLEPSTVAELVLFLCSDAAKNITGTAIPIDGGWTAS